MVRPEVDTIRTLEEFLGSYEDLTEVLDYEEHEPTCSCSNEVDPNCEVH